MQHELSRSMAYDDTVLGGQSVAGENEAISHWSTAASNSPREVLHSMITALEASNLQLARLEMIRFCHSPFNSNFFPTTSAFLSLARYPRLKSLSVLNLGVNMFRTNGLEAGLALASFLQNLTGLKDLTLDLAQGLGSVFDTETDSVLQCVQACEPVLKCLVKSPPFRLEILDVKGLCISEDWPLDRIIRAHSTTLSTLKIIDTDLHEPDPRPLLESIAAANLAYLDISNMRIHGDWNHPLEFILYLPFYRSCGLYFKAGMDASYEGRVDFDVQREDGLWLGYMDDVDGKEQLREEAVYLLKLLEERDDVL